MSRRLSDLSPRFRPLAFEFLARCMEQNIPVRIIDTLRTPEEQADYIAKGVSWTPHSKHLTGDAIDVCPYVVWQASGANKLAWDSSHPTWKRLGEIGEALGLRWGGRWKQRDMGHFELHVTPTHDVAGAEIVET